MLAEAGQELSSSLDYEQTLQHVAELTVPGLADWCVITMREDDVVRQVAVAHADVDKVARARAFGTREPARVGDPIGAGAVIASGKPRLLADMSDERLARAGLAEEEVALVRDLGLRAAIVVPLAIAEQAADRRADAGDGRVGARSSGTPTSRSPPSSRAAPRSRSRTPACTPSVR